MGPLIGAAVLTFLPELLQGFTDYRLIIYGGIIVITLYALPLGIMGTLVRRGTALPEYSAPRGSGIVARMQGAPAIAATPRASVIELSDVSMAFGGVRALNGISLKVRPATVHALIGPNGAGKTVLLNILCGYYPPTAGAIRLEGEPSAWLPAYRVARRRIARTFQTTQLFGELTVLQNVVSGFPEQMRHRFLDSLFGLPRLRREEAGRRDAARNLLAFVGYAGDVNARANSLPFGHQRIARPSFPQAEPATPAFTSRRATRTQPADGAADVNGTQRRARPEMKGTSCRSDRVWEAMTGVEPGGR